jgi:DNA (cytosine-5)-methyltransferase 1
MAWEPLGWDYLWSADIEPFPNAVRAARFPHVPNLGDMTLIAGRILAGEVAAPDLLVGGTPCQSFSVAGLRGGLADERGNLALEFIRLADAIDAVRRAAGKPPAWVLWENVPGVLSDTGNAFGAFLGGLVGSDAPLVPRGRWTDAGVVHGPARCAAWRILDAQHFGLAQRRERVFVLARGGAGAWAAADALLPVTESLRWHPAPRREAGQNPAPTVARGSPGGRTYGLDADTADSLIPTVATTLRARDGKASPDSDCTSTLLAFGGNNTAGPIDVSTALNACKTAAGRQDFESETFITTELAATLRVPSHGAAWRGDGCDNLVAHTLRAEGFDASEDGTGRGTPLVAVAATLSAGGHPNSNAPGRRKEDDTNLVVHAFDARQSGVIQYGNMTGPLDTDQVSIAVMVPTAPIPVGFDTYNQTVSDGATQTLCSRGDTPGGSAHLVPAVQVGMAVRRLTPRECHRLQGFADHHCAVTFRGKPAADGPQYRALGNSMAVPVLAWIGRQISLFP